MQKLRAFEEKISYDCIKIKSIYVTDGITKWKAKALIVSDGGFQLTMWFSLTGLLPGGLSHPWSHLPPLPSSVLCDYPSWARLWAKPDPQRLGQVWEPVRQVAWTQLKSFSLCFSTEPAKELCERGTWRGRYPWPQCSEVYQKSRVLRFPRGVRNVPQQRDLEPWGAICHFLFWKREYVNHHEVSLSINSKFLAMPWFPVTSVSYIWLPEKAFQKFPCSGAGLGYHRRQVFSNWIKILH